MRGRAASKCLRGKEESGADERNRTADLLITNPTQGLWLSSAEFLSDRLRAAFLNPLMA